MDEAGSRFWSRFVREKPRCRPLRSQDTGQSRWEEDLSPLRVPGLAGAGFPWGDCSLDFRLVIPGCRFDGLWQGKDRVKSEEAAGEGAPTPPEPHTNYSPPTTRPSMRMVGQAMEPRNSRSLAISEMLKNSSFRFPATVISSTGKVSSPPDIQRPEA